MLLSQLNYWVELFSCLIANKEIWNILDWIFHCKTILIWKKASPPNSSLSFLLSNIGCFSLKEKSHELAGWFCIFSSLGKLWWPFCWGEQGSSSHLYWMCSWQEREELVTVLPITWQGIWEGSWIDFRCGLGFPDLPAALSRLIPGISWRRGMPPPQFLAQPSVCALLAASPNNCKPTGSPHFWSVVWLIPFFQGDFEDAVAFTCGKWGWILRSWFVPLAWNASKVLGVLLLSWHMCSSDVTHLLLT